MRNRARSIRSLSMARQFSTRAASRALIPISPFRASIKRQQRDKKAFRFAVELGPLSTDRPISNSRGSQMNNPQPIDSQEIPRFSGVSTFMRLPWITDLSQLDVAIIGVPFDGGQSYRTGSRFGPRSVRDASGSVKPYNIAMKVNPYKK